MDPEREFHTVEVDLQWDDEAMDRGFLVTPLGNDRYRVEVDPMGCMIADEPRELRKLPLYGDVIEAKAAGPNTLRFVKVVERSRLRRREYILSQAHIDSPELERVLAKVMGLGGYWERVFGGVLIVYLPKSSTYDMWEDFARGSDT